MMIFYVSFMVDFIIWYDPLCTLEYTLKCNRCVTDGVVFSFCYSSHVQCCRIESTAFFLKNCPTKVVWNCPIIINYLFWLDNFAHIFSLKSILRPEPAFTKIDFRARGAKINFATRPGLYQNQFCDPARTKIDFRARGGARKSILRARPG